jgi:glycosyltransferase involved in cell wall biosynthesis
MLSTVDSSGGAALATYRLHKGLINAEIDSQMLVKKKYTDDFTVIGPKTSRQFVISSIAAVADRQIVKLFTDINNTNFSSAIFGYSDIIQQIEYFNPDIVHLHWIVGGFLTIEKLRKIKKPIIWTIHDMWAFTGGCHYSNDCDRYQSKCGCCPLLNSNSRYDLSNINHFRKMKAWKGLDVTIVSPSRWLAECARKSSIFMNKDIEVIPNGFDLEVFKPISKKTAREILLLPMDSRILLIGADNILNNKRKGIHYLKQALYELARMNFKDEIELVIFGNSEPETKLDVAYKTRYIGKLHDPYSLALVYSAADILINLSTQDNLPNTAIEAMACGTPVASFDIGGMSDIILHKDTGYLAEPFNFYEMAKGIFWIINEPEILERLSINSRNYVERIFKLDLIANKYKALYFAKAQ